MLRRCYFAFVLPIFEYCSLVWGAAAECHLQLLEHLGYSVASLCPDRDSFLSLCHLCRVAGVIMLFKVYSNSNHCQFSEHPLLLEFDTLKLRLQLIHFSLKYQGVKRPNLICLSFWLRLDVE